MCFRIFFAGIPATKQLDSTSLFTNAFAPIIQPLCKVILPTTTAPVYIVTLSSIVGTPPGR